jgi:hypothetical protein
VERPERGGKYGIRLRSGEGMEVEEVEVEEMRAEEMEVVVWTIVVRLGDAVSRI